MSENVKYLKTEEFSDVISSDKVVLVDFWASWCPPCKMLSPVIDELADEYSDKAVICKLNVDEEPQIAQKYGVSSIPTIILFKNGEIIASSVGYKPKAELAKLIDSLI